MEDYRQNKQTGHRYVLPLRSGGSPTAAHAKIGTGLTHRSSLSAARTFRAVTRNPLSAHHLDDRPLDHCATHNDEPG